MPTLVGEVLSSDDLRVTTDLYLRISWSLDGSKTKDLGLGKVLLLFVELPG